MARLERAYQWSQAGGLFPWPRYIDKVEVTHLWMKIAHRLGRRCWQCGETECIDKYWRLTRKDDILAFVHFKKGAYEGVLRELDKHCLLCIKCYHDLRIYTFAWIFSPYSPRNVNDRAHYPLNQKGLHTRFSLGTRYENWMKILPEMYPPGRLLFDKIKSGKIRSLTCGIIGPDGKFMETFIRKSKFHKWVGTQRRPLAIFATDQARHFYRKLYPNVKVGNWGDGDDSHRNLSYEKTGYDALGDDMRKFFTEEPPVWEKLRNPSHSRDWKTGTVN
jgi:hypothetical protein